MRSANKFCSRLFGGSARARAPDESIPLSVCPFLQQGRKKGAGRLACQTGFPLFALFPLSNLIVRIPPPGTN